MRYSTSRLLHEDHMAALALMSDVAREIVARRKAPPRGDMATARLIARLNGELQGVVTAHFDFEEDTVFPLLAEYGEGGLGELLTEEHLALREVMRDVVALGGQSRSEDASEESWSLYRRLCGELIERLQSHIDKEEVALMSALESALSPETDAEVSARYDR